MNKINIIFGPPGTGKTTRLLEILEQELRHYYAHEIAYVSFTREGAYQGRDRALEKFNYEENDFPYFRTLHSIAFRELKMKRTQIMSRKDYKLFSDKMGMKFTGFYTEDFRHNDDLYLFFNMLHRNNKKVASNYLYMLDTKKLRFVYHNYKLFKEHYKLYDFTDIIEMFNAGNRALPVKIAIVDEAQDLTTLQWEMIMIAFKDCEKLYIAGDDDQAIYEWSGADVQYFLNLKGEVEILRHSYRLPESVLQFSKRITNLIEKRVDKEYHGLEKEGNVSDILDLDELDINNKESWLFLSRNQCFLKDIKKYIRDLGMVYESRGELSVAQKDIKLINSYEKIRKSMQMSTTEEALLKIHLKEGFDLRNPWYESFNWDQDKITYHRDLIASKVDLKNCNIKIDTIHSVKGGEADNVVVLLDITRQVARNLDNNPDSEHRVFYVGCTRAKKNLYIMYGTSKYQYKIYGGTK